MNRRTFVTGLAAVLAVPPTAGAQQMRTVRLGWLLPAPKAFALDAFRQCLKELGWTEGSNLVIEERYSRGAGNRYIPLAAELVRLKVDVLVTDGSAATTAAQRATQNIPIVFVSGNPVAAGFAASLSHPGKNLTGVSIITGDVTPKRVQLLKEAASSMMRLTMLEDLTAAGLARSDARFPENWQAIEVASRELGVQLLPTIEVRQPEELDSAFALAVRGRADGVLVLASAFFSAESRRIVSLAANARLPAIYEHRGFVEAGGLISYGADHRAIFRLVADYVDRIVRGAKPADLPIEQPTTFDLVINLKTAKTLGLTIPPSLLLRADQVIE